MRGELGLRAPQAQQSQCIREDEASCRQRGRERLGVCSSFSSLKPSTSLPSLSCAAEDGWVDGGYVRASRRVILFSGQVTQGERDCRDLQSH